MWRAKNSCFFYYFCEPPGLFLEFRFGLVCICHCPGNIPFLWRSNNSGLASTCWLFSLAAAIGGEFESCWFGKRFKFLARIGESARALGGIINTVDCFGGCRCELPPVEGNFLIGLFCEPTTTGNL